MNYLDNPKRPPRGWFRRCMKGVQKSGARNPNAVCGSVWYHKLGDADRRRITRESESYAENPSRTKLDLILDQVKAKRGEVTIDAEGYTPEQVERIKAAAKARGLHVSGTHRWLLIRDLNGVYSENPSSNTLLIGGFAVAAALAFIFWPKKTTSAGPTCPPGPDIIAYANSRGMAVTLFGGLPTSKPPAGYNAATAAAERIYNTTDCAFYKWESFDGAKNTWLNDTKLTAEFDAWMKGK